MEDIVNRILKEMSSVKKWQRTFIASLLTVLTVFQGRATFRNMSRYSEISEKRFSRWYRKSFDFADFNYRLLLSSYLPKPQKGKYIAAMDASFMEKSGKKTEGLGKFFNGNTNSPERGLEIFSVCIVDLQANTAYNLDTRQTMDSDNKTRIDFYADQIKKLVPKLQDLCVDYLVADAFYSKEKFIDCVRNTGLHFVEKLRIDSDLLWLYEGPQRGKGRPKKYDGKVNINKDQNRFRFEGRLDDFKKVHVYSSVVYSKMLKKPIKLVKLCDDTKTILLFSTDLKLNAKTLIDYYKSRFQIEFLFRDARQHTGLTHCQSTKKESIHSQVNGALTALNLLKLEDRKKKNSDDSSVISIMSWKRLKANQNLLKILFSKLGLCLKDQKVIEVYNELSEYGTVAA